MAAAESMGFTFVDEDDLTVAFLRIAHVDSDHEAPSMSIAAMKRKIAMKRKRKVMEKLKTAMTRSKTTPI